LKVVDNIETHGTCCVYTGSATELQCVDIKTEADSDEETECSYDEKPSTGMCCWF